MSTALPARRALGRLRQPCGLCLSSLRRGLSSAARLRQDEKGGKPSRSEEKQLARPSARPPALARDQNSDDDYVPGFVTPYTADEKAKLRERYTPAQMRIIELAENKIKEEELRDQGMIRRDHFSLPYLDDLAHIEPFKDLRAPQKSTYDPKARLKTDEEMQADVRQWTKDYLESPMSADEGPNAVEPAELWEKFENEYRFMTGSEESERNPIISMSQPIPKFKSDHVHYAKHQSISHSQMRLLRESPLEEKQTLKDLKMMVLDIEMVRNQTRMGKIASQRVVAAAGNGKGLLGIGEGKSVEVPTAATAARLQAAKRMVPIPLYEGRTIYGTSRGKSGGVEIELRARPPGFGLRCQGIIFQICKLVGITDISAKVVRGRTKMNVVKATWEALKNQRVPSEIAKARGIKLVDVRAVYYSGVPPERSSQGFGARSEAR